MANSTYEAYSYDAFSRVSNISTKNSSGVVLQSRGYTFDLASQVTQVVEGAITTSYGYDNAGQLTSESKSNGYAAGYTYDGNGNRLTRTVNGIAENYSYDNGDKLLAVAGGSDPRTFAYDAAGRTTGISRSSGTTSFSYDYESRGTQVTKPGMFTNSNSYNGLDTRVAKTDSSGTKTFKRGGVGVTAAVLSDGAASYTPGISEKRGGDSTFFGGGIKNTDTQTDASQAVSASRLYDAFGNVISSTGIWNSPFGNAGKFGYQEDPDTGLKLLGHRYYDSSTGRFLTRDPEQDGRNWYGYCNNSPVDKIDASGLTWYYDQRTGKMTRIVNGKIVKQFKGYSGAEGHQKPEQENLQNKGPIPKGHYKMTRNKSHPYPVFNLTPADRKTRQNQHQRTAFEIHGDSGRSYQSKGCICINKDNLSDINPDEDDDLIVYDSKDGDPTAGATQSDPFAVDPTVCAADPRKSIGGGDRQWKEA